jgi:hypothetical protein
MKRKNQKGQALITLIIFIVVATTVIAGAVAATIINSQATGKLAQSEESLKIAEGGAENAVLKLIRNPNYSGEILSIGNGTATITVTGSGTKTIVSEGTEGNFKRKIQVTGSFVNNVFTISNWASIN